jgi:pimeloyl-ACP methyl ester carboxylesterase
VPEHLLRYDAPAVVVRGQHDSIAPEGWCRQVAALLPQGRYVEVPAVGHTLTWSAPRALAAVVIDQLRRAAPVPGEGPIPVPRGA